MPHLFWKILGKWLEKNQYSYRPKSPMGQAIAYAYKRWAGLSAYVLHGQMEIDNNLVENAVRPMAIGRKAYLFAGSHQAAEMTAAMYSFMASCKQNKINEFEWLKDVLKESRATNKKTYINSFLQTGKNTDLNKIISNKTGLVGWIQIIRA
jgi:transposase